MQATMNADNDLAKAIRDLIANMPRSLDNDLWDAADIAQYMRLSKKSVQSHILGTKGFPNPVILATGGKRWMSKEVKAWVLRHR